MATFAHHLVKLSLGEVMPTAPDVDAGFIRQAALSSEAGGLGLELVRGDVDTEQSSQDLDERPVQRAEVEVVELRQVESCMRRDVMERELHAFMPDTSLVVVQPREPARVNHLEGRALGRLCSQRLEQQASVGCLEVDVMTPKVRRQPVGDLRAEISTFHDLCEGAVGEMQALGGVEHSVLVPVGDHTFQASALKSRPHVDHRF